MSTSDLGCNLGISAIPGFARTGYPYNCSLGIRMFDGTADQIDNWLRANSLDVIVEKSTITITGMIIWHVEARQSEEHRLRIQNERLSHEVGVQSDCCNKYVTELLSTQKERDEQLSRALKAERELENVKCELETLTKSQPTKGTKPECQRKPMNHSKP